MLVNSNLIHQQSILHRDELIRQAEAARLAGEAALSRPPRGHAIRYRLGSWLIAAGERLCPTGTTAEYERSSYATSTHHIAF